MSELVYIPLAIDLGFSNNVKLCADNIVAIQNALATGFPLKAGFSNTLTGLNLVVDQLYEKVLIDRRTEIIGGIGDIGIIPTGDSVIFDVLNDGVSIYSTKPNFAASTGVFSQGTLKTDGTQIFEIGAVLEFVCVQVGSGTPGQKVLITLSARYV